MGLYGLEHMEVILQTLSSAYRVAHTCEDSMALSPQEYMSCVLFGRHQTNNFTFSNLLSQAMSERRRIVS